MSEWARISSLTGYVPGQKAINYLPSHLSSIIDARSVRTHRTWRQEALRWMLQFQAAQILAKGPLTCSRCCWQAVSASG